MPISLVISRPNSPASSSRISAARSIIFDLSAKEVFRYSRKVSTERWIFSSISSSLSGSKVLISSPVAGLTVDIATMVLLTKGFAPLR